MVGSRGGGGLGMGGIKGQWGSRGWWGQGVASRGVRM